MDLRKVILLVDDESIFREFTRVSLEDNGFVVFDAQDGLEAMELFKKFQNRIKTIITDVVMPGMSGKELVEKISKTQNNLQIIFISGYSAEYLAQLGLNTGNVAFLEKPFEIEDLIKTIRN